MGQEIDSARFSENDFAVFDELLREETRQLGLLFEDYGFSGRGNVAGFELEAWLVDRLGRPAPINESYLERLDNPLVVPELSAFNIEINNHPHALSGSVLSRMHAELADTTAACREVAGSMDADLVLTGILPSLREHELCMRHMSGMTRYAALNDQVLKLRHGRPLRLDIQGNEHLLTTHDDVMLEAATTSFQIHLKVTQDNAVRAYNAAQIISAPMVAACANSPFMFGLDLWDETRIPVFEQAVDLGSEHPQRVTFGSGYARNSLFECFAENLEEFAVLLPQSFDGSGERFTHLRLHNGTIWRWNRPLLGFDDDGTPHLRIEHRVVPSGPSIPDTIANAALFFGLVNALLHESKPPETRLGFPGARDNFYGAARNGLNTRLGWLDGRDMTADRLLSQYLIPMASEGLASLNIDGTDADLYLGIISERVRTGQNGARWQREWVARHGRDMLDLTQAYAHQQHRDAPVHEWPC